MFTSRHLARKPAAAHEDEPATPAGEGVRETGGRPGSLSVCSIVTSLTSGGAEMLVAGMNAEFVRQGAKSSVIALCDAETLGNSADMEDRLRNTIEGAGGIFRSLHLHRRRDPISGAWELRRVLRELDPDIVHTHTARAMPILGLAQRCAPVVLTHHNNKLTFSPKLFRLFDAIADEYVAISGRTQRLYRRHTNKAVSLIPNAASIHFGTTAPRTGPASRGRILSVGCVSEQKNYDLLIAVALVLRDRMGTDMPVFTVAGDGPELDRLRATVETLDLAANVRFLGERSDIADLMRASDIYLNTSLWEGMPVSLLEAMAMALPIVATRVDGNRDLVRDGYNGILCSPVDPGAIAETIEALLSDNERYSAISRHSLEEGCRYSMPETARQHLELYDRLARLRRGYPQRP